MNAPQVSLIVPVYNGEKFLAECLASVLAQDFADMEILISDDGSSDGSWSLIEHYAKLDGRIRYWKNPVNLGLAGNFNHCLQEAHGRFIKFVLQDDVLLSRDVVRRLFGLFEMHPQIRLAVTASVVIDSRSQVLELRNHFQPGVTEGRAVIACCLKQLVNLIGEPTLVMFRRADAERGFDPSYRQILDLELWFHLLECGQLGYIAEPLAAFRRHEAQQTEVNRRSGKTNDEGFRLLADYWQRPWLRERFTRRMLFMQIRFLKRCGMDQAAQLEAEMRQRLGRGWWCYLWVERKLRRPVEKLWRYLQSSSVRLRAGRSDLGRR